MSLRLAFDLDGTLADLDGALANVADRLFPDRARRHTFAGKRPAAHGLANSPARDGAQPPRPPADDPPGASREVENALSHVLLSPKQQNAVWKVVLETENFWETLDEIEPGVIRQLAKLALARRWEVIFLTQRPTTAGDTPQVQTQRWLNRWGFPMPSVFVVPGGSRGRVAHALDLHLVVDDRPENCLDVTVESKARAILVRRNNHGPVPTSARRHGIGVVASVAECLDVLLDIDDLSQPGPTVLDRLKKRLGL